MLLGLPYFVRVFFFGFGAQVIARRHAETVGQQIGDSKHQSDTAGETGAGGTADHRERGDRSVDGTKDEVAQVGVACGLGEPGGDGSRGMLRFQNFAPQRRNTCFRPAARAGLALSRQGRNRLR